MANPMHTLASPGLAIHVRAESGGPVIATEAVRETDLRDAVSELWWQADARRHRLDRRPEDMVVTVDPVLGETADPEGASAAGPPRCRGFVLTTTGADGHDVALTCPLATLYPVAQRAAAEPRRRGVVGATASVYYDLRPCDVAPVDRPPARAGEVLGRSRNLEVEALSLAALRSQSRAVGEAAPGSHHLFFTDAALERAEYIARRGESLDPRVETGGVLVGLIGYCDAANDSFVVVIDALEARDAEHREFSLTFHSQTWQQLESIVRVRSGQPGDRALRLLGQVHGHPFDAGSPCAACHETPDCPKHTAYLSEDDRHWSRAVFCGQPWQVGQLFGVDAKGEPTSAVYGLSGGRLETRGYRVIAESDLQAIRHPQP
jgi:hypothetical protein